MTEMGETEKFCMNKATTQVPEFGLRSLSLMRVFGKPFFVSEWICYGQMNFVQKAPYYMLPLALQGWSGLLSYIFLQFQIRTI